MPAPRHARDSDRNRSPVDMQFPQWELDFRVRPAASCWNSHFERDRFGCPYCHSEAMADAIGIVLTEYFVGRSNGYSPVRRGHTVGFNLGDLP